MSTSTTETFLTREGLANRWEVSRRTIDRKRKLGLLPWVDLSGGIGARPQVRFRLKDIERYEQQGVKEINCNA